MFLLFLMHMPRMDNRRPCSSSIKRHGQIGLVTSIFSHNVGTLFLSGQWCCSGFDSVPQVRMASCTSYTSYLPIKATMWYNFCGKFICSLSIGRRGKQCSGRLGTWRDLRTFGPSPQRPPCQDDLTSQACILLDTYRFCRWIFKFLLECPHRELAPHTISRHFNYCCLALPRLGLMPIPLIF